MGIPEALKVCNQFLREIGRGANICQCGHAEREHKHRRGSKRPTEPCSVKGCVCCDFRAKERSKR